LFDCCLNPSGAETEKADALPVVKQCVLHQQGQIHWKASAISSLQKAASMGIKISPSKLISSGLEISSRPYLCITTHCLTIAKIRSLFVTAKQKRDYFLRNAKITIRL